MLWPNGTTEQPAVSSPFGPRNLANPIASKNHLGVDMYGFPTVCAVDDGTVVYVGWYSGVGWSTVAGYMVWVQHDGFFSRSLHTDPDTVRVSVGQKVRAGDPLVDMGWSGLANSWDEHVHLEITPGQWHSSNSGQVDPVPFIAARLGDSASGGGSVAPDNTSTESEEDDDMSKMYRIYGDSPRKGRHYSIGDGMIVGIDKDTVMMNESAGYPDEIPVKEASFKAILRRHGVDRANGVDVVNAKGDVLDERASGEYKYLGSWFRGDYTEKLAYRAQD